MTNHSTDQVLEVLHLLQGRVVDNDQEFTNDRHLIDNTDKATHIKVSEDDSPFMWLLSSTGKAVCFTFALKYSIQIQNIYRSI